LNDSTCLSKCTNIAASNKGCFCPNSNANNAGSKCLEGSKCINNICVTPNCTLFNKGLSSECICKTSGSVKCGAKVGDSC